MIGRACVHEGLCSDQEQFRDPCEWNPQQGRAAFMCEVHASADMIVGANGRWRLCHTCAALPVFRRLRKRKPLRPSE